MKARKLTIIVCLALFFSTALWSQANAQEAACWVTKFGNPAGEPKLPSACSSIIQGITLPPNLGPCVKVGAEYADGVAGEYCKMPPSLNGAYTVGSTWGSKEMIGVLYTVAQAWKNNHPQGYIRIMDISAHHGDKSEHDWGIAVDINATTNGHDCVADMQKSNRICTLGPYDGNGQKATIELAKMFLDTGYFDVIWYNDPVVIDAFWSYAHNKYSKKFTKIDHGQTGMRALIDHENHFHFDIDRTGRNSDNHSDNFHKSKLKKCQTVSSKVC